MVYVKFCLLLISAGIRKKLSWGLLSFGVIQIFTECLVEALY